MVSALLPLRPYQRQALDAWKEARKEEDRNRWAIVLPTGGGKTVCFAHASKEWLDDHPADRVLILVHTDELVQQAAKKVRDIAPHLVVGIVKAKQNEVTADVIVASVQTLRSAARRAQLRSVSLIIIDECHHATAPTYRAIMADLNALGDVETVQVLGCTATLVRGDGGDLSKIWGDRPAFTRDISWMVRKRYLIPPLGKSIEVPDLDLSKVKSTRADYREGELGEALAESLAPVKVAEAIHEHASDRKVLAFFPTVSSAYVFAAAIEDIGIDARVIHGGMSTEERRNVLAWHRRGTVLVNCMILTEGYDDPEVDCIVVGRPTKSKGLYIQIVGRGLRVDPARPYEDQTCLLLDVVGSSKRHDLRSIIDLSEKPLSEKNTEGKTLTELEDEFDAGEGVEEDTPVFWDGDVVTRDFDPMGVAARSKVWIKTKGGTYFVPAGKRLYVFVLEYPRPGRWSVAWCTTAANDSVGYCEVEKIPSWKCEHDGSDGKPACTAMKRVALTAHADLDLELAMTWAEDLAVDFGADTFNLANKKAAWRKKQPSEKMLNLARSFGVRLTPREVDPVTRTVLSYVENAGKVSDFITTIQGTRRIDPLVEMVKGKMK